MTRIKAHVIASFAGVDQSFKLYEQEPALGSSEVQILDFGSSINTPAKRNVFQNTGVVILIRGKHISSFSSLSKATRQTIVGLNTNLYYTWVYVFSMYSM